MNVKQLQTPHNDGRLGGRKAGLFAAKTEHANSDTATPREVSLDVPTEGKEGPRSGEAGFNASAARRRASTVASRNSARRRYRGTEVHVSGNSRRRRGSQYIPREVK